MAETEGIVGRVAEIWRYPVQSMRGERLDGAEITADGVVGDRAYGLVDPELGQVVSSSQGKRKWRAIVTLAARYASAPAAAGAPIEILLPDGSRLTNGQPDIDDRLGAALGSPAADNVWSEYRIAALHVLTTASLRQLADHHPEGRFEPARFRPNFVLDLGEQKGFVEQGWLERRFRIGAGVEIRISEYCKRCVMTTLSQGDLPFDPAILHTVNQANHTHAGAYATVVSAGRINVGDPVHALA